MPQEPETSSPTPDQLPEAIAVFGSSDPLAGEPEYESARRVGSLIARQGRAVVCGGYGGVMEAVARGAREAGGIAIGVTCSSFRERLPNRWLSQQHEEPDLFCRTRRLMDLARGFIILPGKSGTLAEVAFLWALRRAQAIHGKPVVLLGSVWASILKTLISAGVLEEDSLADTVSIGREEEAVAAACGLKSGERRR